ncbi:unnamed protein product [Clonostachys rosea f. rosea IK726]|uniref:Uncharacterized protein n=1 Tax=Clonostachys rosea f. rosea IK726 TaxID=1349383 RepID=A0ACA9URY0_BIOOC|nr:unnamed protein product [Clonostachys rosea f. rosea IK726]
MVCNMCSDTLKIIWEPSHPRRLCPFQDVFPGARLPRNKNLAPDHPEHYLFGHHPTLNSLSDAINSGCSICKRLHTPIEYSEQTKLNQLGYFSALGVEFEDLPILTGYTDHGGWFSQPLLPVESPMLSLSRSTGDLSAIALIRSWLETCVQSHKGCNKATEKPFIPPRLLQLNTESNSFRLVSATEVPPGIRYTTFIHCYRPGDDGMQLLESTLKRFSSQQSLSILPQSYRDACLVTTQIGVSYIWIDQLCAMQDSQFDQSAHQNIMRQQILTNGFCGIGAAGSTSSSSGLFTQSDRSTLSPDIFNFQAKRTTPSIPYTFFAELDSGKVKAFRYEPISKNARALRDRLSVPRMVYFGRQMLFWDCHTSHYNEFGLVPPEHLPQATGREGELTDDGKLVIKLWKPLFEYHAVPYDDPIDQILNSWTAFIMTYTRHTDVSPTERLCLLQNLALEAKQLLIKHDCSDAIYLAGMWKISFPWALLWQSRSVCDTQTAASYAPSWSWAAVDGEVFFLQPGTMWSKGLVCELINRTCDLDDITGTMTSASITIRGKLLLGKLASFPPGVGLDDKMWILSLTDAKKSTGLSLTAGPVKLPTPDEWTVRFDSGQDKSAEVLCLPVQAYTATSCTDEVEHCLHGILLFQLDDGRYVRRGYWSITMKSLDKALHAVDDLHDFELEII